MNQIVEFIYDRTTGRPRRLKNNVFVLYSPKRIRIQPGEKINIFSPGCIYIVYIIFFHYLKFLQNQKSLCFYLKCFLLQNENPNSPHPIFGMNT